MDGILRTGGGGYHGWPTMDAVLWMGNRGWEYHGPLCPMAERSLLEDPGRETMDFIVCTNVKLVHMVIYDCCMKESLAKSLTTISVKTA